MKKFIDVHIPITNCNLECHYCYVSHTRERGRHEQFIYSADCVGKALTKERLGGICHFNLCGLGETLIPLETIAITKELLKNGHYVMIVTNATLTDRIKQLCDLPEEYRERLGFKCSFHYLELLRRNLLDVFVENVNYIRKSGCSVSIEMTPTDELEQYIDQIKCFCYENFGALCHLTIPRDMRNPGYTLLSKRSFDDFCNIWSCFDSELFEFKRKHWAIKRKEFCYAGAWSALLNLNNGKLTSCYGLSDGQDIFKNVNSDIRWNVVGEHCQMPHCYNSHSLLGLGVIPEVSGNYALMRDRVDIRDGSHWLNDEMRDFLSDRLEFENEQLSNGKKKKANRKRKLLLYHTMIKQMIKRVIGK